VRFDKLTDEGGEGFNHWYRLVLKEGRNRVVRRTFEALGLTVSRLMRVRFGIVNLPPSIKRGKMAELGAGEVEMILDWVGLSPALAEIPPPARVERANARKGETKEPRVETDSAKPSPEVMPVRAPKAVGRRGQADMSRSQAHRKVKSGKKS
jgi:23S rRNA pseudouridine2605 synthase